MITESKRIASVKLQEGGSSDGKDSPVKLGIEPLVGLFLFLGAMLAGGLATFLLEICSARRTRRTITI